LAGSKIMFPLVRLTLVGSIPVTALTAIYG
jgi:hypothetical protein